MKASRNTDEEMKPFYGWVVLAALWIGYVLIGGPTYGLSILTTRMVLELGLSEDLIGYTTSSFYLMLTLASIPASLIIRKKGHRFTLALGGLLNMAAFAVLYVAPPSTGLYVAMFGALGLGFLWEPA